MTKVEQNKFAMYCAIESILGNFTSDIETKPLLKDIADAFKSDLQEIRDKDNTYLNVKKGSTADKDSAEEELIEELLAKGGALHVIARKKNDGNLKLLSDVKRSNLKHLRDTELMQRAKLILESFKENQEELKNHGMTDTSLTELENAVNDYEDAVNNRDTKHAEGKASRKDLKALFTETDDILKNELDRLMEMVKDDSEEFYNQYKAARTIKDLGFRKKQTSSETAAS